MKKRPQEYKYFIYLFIDCAVITHRVSVEWTLIKCLNSSFENS